MGTIRDMAKEYTKKVSGMISVGGQRRNRSKWWSEVSLAVAKNQRFEEWLQRRDGDTYDRYRASCCDTGS